MNLLTMIEKCWKLEGGVYIGCDFADGKETCVESKVHPDGAIEILDYYEIERGEHE